MNQKGFGLIIFIIFILIALSGIIGGFLVIKKYYPSAIPHSSNTPETTEQKDINNESTNSSAIITPKPDSTSEELRGDAATIDMANKIRSVLTCHFNKYGKYPADMLPDEDCLSKNLGPNIVDPDVSYSLDNYVVSNNGLNYSLEFVIAPGKGYIITDKGVNYIEIPQDIMIMSSKRTRDASRIFNLDGMGQMIVMETIFDESLNFLCANGQFPCFGDSRAQGASSTDGTGWIKINFNSIQNIHVEELPIDPVNNEKFHYVYCADKTGWEINAVFESDNYADRMKTDNGDDNSKYEIGSNLNLINKISGCKY